MQAKERSKSCCKGPSGRPFRDPCAMTEILQPSVTALRAETLLVPFTDYSQWERKHPKGSGLGVRTQQQAKARILTPLSAPRVRKNSKSTAPEAKKQRANHATSTAQVRLQPVAFVCNHGQGIRRKPAPKFNTGSIASSGESQVKVFKRQGQQVSISPEKQHKTGRLGRSHEPTNIRLLRVTQIKPAYPYQIYRNFVDCMISASTGSKKKLY